MKKLKDLGAKMVNAKTPYPQQMYLNQVNYLFRVATAADQIPGDVVFTRFDELKAEFENLQQEFNE